MNQYKLLFESSPWLIGVGMLLGVLYAGILYFRVKSPWSKQISYVLAVLRFLMVTQLSLLLFGPLIRQIKNTIEPPAIVLAVDNSSSIAEMEDSLHREVIKNKIIKLRSALQAKGYKVEVRTLAANQATDLWRFDYPSSNINSLLKDVQNEYESRNLASVVLYSDGLFNLGNNPLYQPYHFTINTVGLGDTTSHPDINLNALLCNKIAYQGNKYPVIAELFSYHLAGSTVKILLKQDGRVLESKQIDVKNHNQFDRVKFLVEAKNSGMRRLQVSVIPVAGEYITANNSKEAYVDVINGKQKILLVASAPHPDIKALTGALEKNKNYEVVLYIDGLNTFKEQKYDVVILHQVPGKGKKYSALMQRLIHDKIPAFYIYGNNNDLNTFNQTNGLVKILPISYQLDNVFPVYNTGFGIFNYENSRTEIIAQYTPVKVPFANYQVSGQGQILLYQQVGNINTKKPLLVVGEVNSRRTAVMLGDGMWRWRLQEYARTQAHTAFDEMMSKIIQYLSTKEDKRKFRVYTVKNEFLNNEAVAFETETYNDLYEQTYGHKVTLRITDKEKNTRSFSYVTGKGNRRYEVNGLDNGVYNFTATTLLDGKPASVSGIFTVKDLQIETTRLKADHRLLKNLASANGGKFYNQRQMDQLRADLEGQEMVNKIYSSQEYLAIINMKWGFFMLLILVSAEWFLRKYYGSY